MCGDVMLGSRKTTFASRFKKLGESDVDGSQSGVGDEGILCSFLPVLGRGDLLFRPLFPVVVVGWWTQR